MGDPYFKINPIKIEIIKQSPAHVVLYHSVLSENEVEKIESYNIEVSKAIIKTFTLTLTSLYHLIIVYYKIINVIVLYIHERMKCQKCLVILLPALMLKRKLGGIVKLPSWQIIFIYLTADS